MPAPLVKPGLAQLSSSAAKAPKSLLLAAHCSLLHARLRPPPANASVNVPFAIPSHPSNKDLLLHTSLKPSSSSYFLPSATQLLVLCHPISLVVCALYPCRWPLLRIDSHPPLLPPSRPPNCSHLRLVQRHGPGGGDYESLITPSTLS